MNEDEYRRIADRYGPEIAQEVASRLVSIHANMTPALLAYADTLPDYLAGQAVRRREMAARRALVVRRKRAPRERQGSAGDPDGYVRGAAHPSARLTDDLVRSIRSRRAGGESPSAIAADVGVSRRTIHLILSGKRWAHVTDTAPSTIPIHSTGDHRDAPRNNHD